MKLKQFIREATDNIANINTIKTYFDVEGDITSTDKGIVVDGNLSIKENNTDVSKMTEIPVKIYEVTGNFHMAACNVTSLKNAPTIATNYSIMSNYQLRSLVTDEPIICKNTFNASNCNISNLDNVKINTDKLALLRCDQLQSITGISGNISLLMLSGSNQIKDDPMLIPGLKEIRCNPYSTKDLPLIRMILSTDVAFKIDISSNVRNTQLENIINTFSKKGPSKAIDLIRALRDAGFASHAKL